MDISMDIFMDINGKSVDMDMDGKFQIHSKPGYSTTHVLREPIVSPHWDKLIISFSGKMRIFYFA